MKYTGKALSLALLISAVAMNAGPGKPGFISRAWGKTKSVASATRDGLKLVVLPQWSVQPEYEHKVWVDKDGKEHFGIPTEDQKKAGAKEGYMRFKVADKDAIKANNFREVHGVKFAVDDRGAFIGDSKNGKLMIRRPAADILKDNADDRKSSNANKRFGAWRTAMGNFVEAHPWLMNSKYLAFLGLTSVTAKMAYDRFAGADLADDETSAAKAQEEYPKVDPKHATEKPYQK